MKVTSSVVKGALIGVLMVAFSLTVQFTMSMQETQKIGWISYAILFIGVIVSCIHYANQMQGAVTFGNVFVYGFKVTALVTLIVSVFTYISIKFIFPDMVDKAIEVAREQMQKQPDNKMTDANVEQALGMTRKYFAVFVVGASLFINMFIGTLAALVGAVVAKKDPNAVTNNEFNQIGS